MEVERPEYPETTNARRKGWACAALAVALPLAFWAGGMPEAAPYAFSAFLVLAAVFGFIAANDRLHRRIDALRDGD
ncbi:MAG TPA: hypothetical protein VGO06_28450 [Bosea sp. (in: a-proteobacteria)]|uniref:hypothetical protein n=1 Tax=Bosea sp. (in: a-proteobacteria) TaxID=1871050 RepID=UPI002E0D2508|nr:hypothetical protein [Bosea sp. (in: a-proteobacteria)]